MGDFITGVANGKKPDIMNSLVVPVKTENFREILSGCWDMAQNGEDKFEGINNWIELQKKYGIIK